MSETKTFLCVASHLKGFHFIREAHRLGCKVYLLTHQKLMNEPWPRELIEDVFVMPNFQDMAMVRNVVSYLARKIHFDQLIPMGDYDVEVTAALREHLRLPGMGVTASANFRDKLAMRDVAAGRGLPVPAYTGLFHDPQILDYVDRVPGPWVLKPRAEAGSKGIQVLETPEAVWKALDELGDARSLHLLEAFVPGDLYHVDGVVHDGKVVFASAQRYGAPMLTLRQAGGIYTTATIPRGTIEHRELLTLNRDVVGALGMQQGVFHIEYLRDRNDGKFYFLEAAARVGAAKIPDVIFYATGVCLWHEWAKLEAATPERPYVAPVPKSDHAGVLITVAKQQWPDTTTYDAAEIVWRQQTRPYHAGLLVSSPSQERVEELVTGYALRFAREFAP